jgi:hypothetical protein
MRLALTAAAGMVLVGEGGRRGDSLTERPGSAWGSFAARVTGTGTFLLLALDTAGAVIGHACDGRALSVWFTGRLIGNTITTATGGARLVATAGPGRVDGRLLMAGNRRFTLMPVGGGGGLYAARAAADGIVHTAGWIVLADGTQCGTLLSGTETGPAPSLPPDRTGPVRCKGVRLHPVRLDRLSPKWGRFTGPARLEVGRGLDG